MNLNNFKNIEKTIEQERAEELRDIINDLIERRTLPRVIEKDISSKVKRMSEKAALDWLLTFLWDKENRTRDRRIVANRVAFLFKKYLDYGQLFDFLITLLEDPREHYEIRQAACEYLEKLWRTNRHFLEKQMVKADLINRLFKVLEYKPIDYFIDAREDVIRTLAELQITEAIPILIQFVQDEKEDLSLRIAAAKNLGKFQSLSHFTEITQVLIKAMDKKWWYLRKAAASALAQLKSQKAIPILRKALMEDDFCEVRVFAAKALGNMKAAEAISDLFYALLNDLDYWVQIKAAWALGEMERKDVAAILLEAFKKARITLPKEDEDDRSVEDNDRRVKNAIAEAFLKIHKQSYFNDTTFTDLTTICETYLNWGWEIPELLIKGFNCLGYNVTVLFSCEGLNLRKLVISITKKGHKDLDPSVVIEYF